MMKKIISILFLIGCICTGMAFPMDFAHKVIQSPQLANAITMLPKIGCLEEQKKIVNSTIYPLLDSGCTINGVTLQDGKTVIVVMTEYIESDTSDPFIVELYQDIIQRLGLNLTRSVAIAACEKPPLVKSQSSLSISSEDSKGDDAVSSEDVDLEVDDSARELHLVPTVSQEMPSLSFCLFELVDQFASGEDMLTFCEEYGASEYAIKQALNQVKISVLRDWNPIGEEVFHGDGLHTPLSYAIEKIALEKDSIVRERLASLIKAMIRCGARIVKSCRMGNVRILNYMRNIIHDSADNELREFFLEIAYKLGYDELYLAGVEPETGGEPERALTFSKTNLYRCWGETTSFIEEVFSDESQESVRFAQIMKALIDKKFKWCSIVRLFHKLGVSLKQLCDYCNTYPMELETETGQPISVFGYVLRCFIDSYRDYHHSDEKFIDAYSRVLEAMVTDGVNPVFLFAYKDFNPLYSIIKLRSCYPQGIAGEISDDGRRIIKTKLIKIDRIAKTLNYLG